MPSENRARSRTRGTLREDALWEIDAYAEAQGFTRSGFLLKAARLVFEGV